MKREELKITRYVGHNKQEVEISIEAERVFTIIDKTWSVDYATEEFEKQCNMSSKNVNKNVKLLFLYYIIKCIKGGTPAAFRLLD